MIIDDDDDDDGDDRFGPCYVSIPRDFFQKNVFDVSVHLAFNS